MLSQSQVNAFYTERLAQYGVNVQALGWGSENSQCARLSKIVEIIAAGHLHTSVLDVGCGFGDLCQRILPKSRYTGIDIHPRMINEARLRYPDHNFILGEIEIEPVPEFDWVVASGLFAFGFNADIFLTMYHKAKIGVVCNFLSEFTAGERMKDRYYADPSDVLRIVKRLTGSINAVIDHNYLHNDFTLAVYK